MSPTLVSWLFLLASILFEVFGMLLFKFANGFKNIPFTTGAIACFSMSFWLMSFSLKHIELGISYAVWAAASTALVALAGMAFYNESMDLFKLTGILLITVGVVLLNLASK